MPCPTAALSGRNTLENEVFATPSICGSRVYARVGHLSAGTLREPLYCIGDKATASRR